jgi:putative addiction module component (TIGR02574 family)
MAMIPFSELRKLSVAERIQLAQDLWDSIAEDADALPVTTEQQAELDQRLADAEQDPGAGRSWLDVKSRLLNGR